ncbi:hypothetical protein V3C99_009776 [Haemonchus contortus]
MFNPIFGVAGTRLSYWALYVYALLLLLPLVRRTSSESCPPCPAGFQCDTNTGICRPFRPAYTTLTELPCGDCPQGTMCDSNTGLCRVFRFPGNYDQTSTSLCAKVVCPTEYMCDNNTGACRKFRVLALPVK